MSILGHDNKDDARFTHHLETLINSGRWDDAVEALQLRIAQRGYHTRELASIGLAKRWPQEQEKALTEGHAEGAGSTERRSLHSAPRAHVAALEK